jgi:lantibiotic biosynthesis protein
MFPAGGVDLGVAHGIAGVIPLLARAYALGVRRETAAALLAGAVAWLSAHLLDTAWGRTVPGFVAEDTAPDPARSAWCYGDPGVGTVLLLAARETGDSALADLGLELAMSAAARPPELTGVTDAGLCHGSAGLTHLFGRMHQLTGVPDLAEAARFWAGRTVDDCSAALASATPTAPEAAPPPWNGPGLLEGAAGIMLALLSAATPTEPVWDPMFLVATTPNVRREPR